MNCVHAKTLYTGTGVAKDAYLLYAGRTVRGISRRRQGRLVGSYATVTPAFIDPHSHIGMHRSGEPAGEGEANEWMDAILAVVDALDSVQLDDMAFGEAVEMGVLYSCVVPGSGNLIGGHAAVIRNYARDSSAALVARAGLKGATGFNPMANAAHKGTRATTRMGGLALLRQKLDGVRLKMEQYRKARGQKRSAIAFTAEERVLREVLEQKLILRVHCHKIDDIASLLRLADEFSLKITVEHAADVNAPGIFRELARRKIPVIFGPVDAFPYKVELKHDSWRNVRFLLESKCRFGLMTDHPVTLAKMLLLQTRHFLRFGLSKQDAIELISRRNAEVLGLGKILGSLQKGRWASFTCWNGDPFDLAAYPVLVVGEGDVVYEEGAERAGPNPSRRNCRA